MAVIHLIRHGRAAAGFDGHPDPGLDEVGRAQARAAATRLAPLGPLRIVTSPMARARETAQPLCALWRTTAAIEPRVSEIPTPGGDPTGRSNWLHGVMQGSWTDLDADLLAWRRALVDWLIAQPDDAAVFTHFIAINVAVGAAGDDLRVVVFRPDNASITTLDNAGGRLTVTTFGDSGETTVT